MKNVVLFALGLLTLGAGCAKNQFSVTNPPEKIVIDAQPAAVITTTANVSRINPLAAKVPTTTTNNFLSVALGNITTSTLAATLCRDKQVFGLSGYEGGEFLKCGEYFKIIPPENLEDAPDILFTSAGKLAAKCGGMPESERSDISPICSVPCALIGVPFCLGPAAKDQTIQVGTDCADPLNQRCWIVEQPPPMD